MTLAAPATFAAAALPPASAGGAEEAAIAAETVSAPGGFLAELLAWSSALGSEAGPQRLRAPRETSEEAEVSIASDARTAYGSMPPAGERQQVVDAAGLTLAPLLTPAVVAAPATPRSNEPPGSKPVPVDPSGSVLPPGAAESVAPSSSPSSGVRPDCPTAAPASPNQAPGAATPPAEPALSARPLPPAARALPRNEAARGELALAMALTQKAPAHPLETSRAPEAPPLLEAPGSKPASAAGPMASVPEPSSAEGELTRANAALGTVRAAWPAREPEVARAADGRILRMRSPGASAEPQAEPGRPVPATAAAVGPAESSAHFGQSGVRPEPQPSGRPSTPPGAAPALPSEAGRALDDNGAPRIGSPAPVRRIELRLARQAAEAVTVEVAERRGRIELAVRTPDRELAASLGEQAAEIVRRLETAGFRAQAWTPQAPARPGEPRLELVSQTAPDLDHHSGGGRQHGDDRHPEERSRREPDPEFPLEQFAGPRSGGKEIDS